MISPESQPMQMVLASAGSGKTFQLVHRYLALLVRGVPAGDILATTFSRKAAHEILERVIRLLVEGAEDKATAAAIGERIGVPSFSSLDAQQLVLELIQEQSRMLIGTLDSFAQTLGRLFHEEIGLPEQWDIPDTVAAQSVEAEALHIVLADPSIADRETLLAEMSSHDAARTVFSRIHGVLSRLRSTFIEVPLSAWEWKVEELIQKPAVDPQELLETLKVLEIPKTQKGKPNATWKKANDKACAALESEEWSIFLSGGVGAAIARGATEFSRCTIPDQWLDTYTLANHFAVYMAVDALVQKTKKYQEFLALFTVVFERVQAERQVFGFDDVKHALSGVFGDISKMDLAYRLDRKVQHLLLDEFQDTTPTEWALLASLVDEVASDPSGQRTLFVVGDPKQAIYGWRGGSAELSGYLAERYAPNLVVSPLTKSYRSSPVVIDFVNQVFGNLSGSAAFEEHREAAKIWEAGFNEHESAQSELSGFVSIEQIDKDEEATDRVASDVAELLSKSPGTEIGVLVRTNSELLPHVLAFERAGIEVSAEGGSPLTDSPVVVAVLALLHAAVHPGDTRSWFHVQQTPLGSYCAESIDLSDRVSLEALSLRIREQISEQGLAACLREMFPLFKDCSSARDEVRSEQLLELAVHYDNSLEHDLERFIARVRAERVEELRPGVVRIMTVHRAKGLEFDAVFLPNLTYSFTRINDYDLLTEKDPGALMPSRVICYADRNLRPHVPRLEAMYEQALSERIQEELSVFYVAITRAKQAMYIYVEEPTGKETLNSVALLRSEVLKGESSIAQGDLEWWRGRDVEEKEVLNPERISLSWPRPQGEEQRKKFFSVRTASSGRSVLKSRGEMDRGKALHALCEQVTWLEDSPELTGELVEEFNALLQAPELASCFSKERYAGSSSLEVYSELPFSFMVGEELFTGVIDRLVIFEREQQKHAEIIDMKTGYQQMDEQALRKLMAPQLSLYREGVKRLFPETSENIQATLCLLDRGAAFTEF